MTKVAYKIAAAGWSVDSAVDPRTELIELDVLQEMNGPCGYCRVTAFAPAAAPVGAGGLAASATAALGRGGPGAAGPSATVRGQNVRATDAMTVELTAGDVSGLVATASVQTVETSLEVVTLVGSTGMQLLAETRLNQVYENQSLNQIVTDLAGQAGVTVGNVDQGSTYPYLAVHESRSVLRAILALARREGMDVYFDNEDKLQVTAFAKATADHVLRYGVEVLELAVRSVDPGATKVLVHGESPASSTGTDTWHQLVSDLSPYRGESGSGARARAIQDGAIRSKAAADAAAAARLAAIRDRAMLVRVATLGRPTLKLGDAVELRDAPGLHSGGVLKVGSLRHVFNRRAGYVTVAGLSPRSPAGALGVLPGAVGGVLG